MARFIYMFPVPPGESKWTEQINQSFRTDNSEQTVHHCQTAVTVLSVQLKVCTVCYSVCIHLTDLITISSLVS